MRSFRAAALTNIGRVRQENEDRFLFDEKHLWFGVADGVGGLPGGAEAAQMAVDEIVAQLSHPSQKQPPDLTAVAHAANRAVVRLGQRMSPSTGIGTTLTFGLVLDSHLQIAHVGDSRCYMLRDGGIRQLTEDHSVENEARLRRERGEIVYYHEMNRHALTRCIGQPTLPEVDVIEQPMEPGDRYLFCTDGVTRMIPDAELGSLLARFEDPQASIERIVGLAVSRGGPDNATAVVCTVVGL